MAETSLLNLLERAFPAFDRYGDHVGADIERIVEAMKDDGLRDDVREELARIDAEYRAATRAAKETIRSATEKRCAAEKELAEKVRVRIGCHPSVRDSQKRLSGNSLNVRQ